MIIGRMVIHMNEARLTTIEQIEQFLNASSSIEFSAADDDGERYGHITRVLTRFDYPGRQKRERGVLLRYLQHTSGYSRAQVTRLVTRWQRNRLAEVPLAKRYRAPAAPFARKYTALDVALLVEMDQAHEDVSYTHLDVYKRQTRRSANPSCRRCSVPNSTSESRIP